MKKVTEITDMEMSVIEAIVENTDVESMECVDFSELVELTGINSKSLKGVLGSLVKKEIVIIEDYDANGKMQEFYWLKEHMDQLYS